MKINILESVNGEIVINDYVIEKGALKIDRDRVNDDVRISLTELISNGVESYLLFLEREYMKRDDRINSFFYEKIGDELSTVSAKNVKWERSEMSTVDGKFYVTIGFIANSEQE